MITTDDRGRVAVGPPKTEAGRRTVALPPWLRPVLDEHIDTYNLGAESWLFPAPDGGLMDPRRLRARFWLPAVKAAACPALRPHQIRHLHASILFDSGRPLTEIAARLGHENTQVTASVYAHWLRTDDSASAEAIPDITRRVVG